jgi:hypothetical protein
MVRLRSLFLTGIFCFVLLAGHAFAGNRFVHGFSKDAATGLAIPFPKIVVEGGAEWMGDMEGNFTLSVPEGQVKVTVMAYQYIESEVNIMVNKTIDG